MTVAKAAFFNAREHICGIRRRAGRNDRACVLAFLICVCASRASNIFASSFFTALNNGVISAAISFLRTLVLQMLSVLILPIFFELEGIWWAITVRGSVCVYDLYRLPCRKEEKISLRITGSVCKLYVPENHFPRAALSLRRRKKKYAVQSSRLTNADTGTAMLIMNIPVSGRTLKKYESGIRTRNADKSPCAMTNAVCSRPLK